MKNLDIQAAQGITAVMVAGGSGGIFGQWMHFSASSIHTYYLYFFFIQFKREGEEQWVLKCAWAQPVLLWVQHMAGLVPHRAHTPLWGSLLDPSGRRRLTSSEWENKLGPTHGENNASLNRNWECSPPLPWLLHGTQHPLELGKGVFTFSVRLKAHSDSPDCLANVCGTKLCGQFVRTSSRSVENQMKALGVFS